LRLVTELNPVPTTRTTGRAKLRNAALRLLKLLLKPPSGALSSVFELNNSVLRLPHCAPNSALKLLLNALSKVRGVGNNALSNAPSALSKTRGVGSSGLKTETDVDAGRKQVELIL